MVMIMIKNILEGKLLTIINISKIIKNNLITEVIMRNRNRKITITIKNNKKHKITNKIYNN